MTILWNLLIILQCISNIYSGEIITLENKTHLICATDDKDSIIYIKPPILGKTKNSQILIEDDNVWNDWFLKNSTDTLQGPVLDKRWEDFETIYTNHSRFISASSLSVSVYLPDQIKFYLTVDQSLHKFFISPNAFEPWVHYTVILRNGSVDIFEYLSKSYRLARTIKNFVPSQIALHTNTMTYWKLHNYNVRWAESISQSPISIPISSNDSSCLTLSVGNTYSFGGGNDTPLPIIESWKTKRIEVEAGNNITLMRYTRNGSPVGHWTVDIRKCPKTTKSDRVIYEVMVEDVKNEMMNRICYTMSDENQTEHNSHDRSINESESWSCHVGSLGKKCDVSCEDLLGSERTYCQKHKICENSQCFCAWGFTGPLCDQENVMMEGGA